MNLTSFHVVIFTFIHFLFIVIFSEAIGFRTSSFVFAMPHSIFIIFQLHPDRSMHHQASASCSIGDHKKFVELQEAYSILRNPATRKDYDIRSRLNAFMNETQSSSDSSQSNRYQYKAEDYECEWKSRPQVKRERKARDENRASFDEARERKRAKYYATQKIDSRSIINGLVYAVLLSAMISIALLFVEKRLEARKLNYGMSDN
jgi:hypothetical protein